MKRYIALALVCLALTDVMAQKQKVVEKIVDEDYYPVDGAVVTLKRTTNRLSPIKMEFLYWRKYLSILTHYRMNKR